ncbi:hypothetical protein J2045_001942 [Peteryoungia aggregata LMG 23059]|uniref:Transposase n=1 Tax=Peteryoungia aggregata LMG 23059 TaxID=1368425 RepID=A0ABU0G6E7_9HYPH|nr:hypothetical protein [Peteryoungia aggregata]MDQ0420915.1 hypothetical protein [Peteryoungia aggregata LMG 23059]
MKTTEPTPVSAPFTAKEAKIHTYFAVRAARKEGWANTSAQFRAMKCECLRHGLRACDFQYFRKRIRAMRGYHLFWTTRRTSTDLSQKIVERTPRAETVASLLRALDRISIVGW